MDRSSADKALGNWKPTAKQPITESNWNLLLRYSHVDKARSPAAQGYQIVDEVKALPSGPMKRRHDPLMIGSGGEAGEKDSDGKNNIPVGKLASVNSSYSGTNLASKTLWSDQEINELVRLRCHGLTYPAIAKGHLPGRDLKAIQLKFAKLKKVSPFKEQWEKYKTKDVKIVKGGGGNQVGGS